MTMGLTHPGTGRGMRSRTIGSRKTVPPRMLRICVRGVRAGGRRRALRQRKKKGGWLPDASPGWGRPGIGTRTYGAIGRTPHLLQLELLHACLVRRDGRALDADVVLKDRLGRLDRYLVIGLCGQTDRRAGGRGQ